MSDSAPVAVGVDFGGTSIKLGVCRGADLLEVDEPIPTQGHDGPVALIRVMADRIAKLQERHPEICAVGVGVPGLVDFDNGFVHVLTNVPGWKEVPLKQILSEMTGLPTVVENDANAMAYAEWRYGAGQGLRNVVALTLGTGVGGGLILNNELYRGSQFSAGEIGQMSVHYQGVHGHYGNLGALEKYVGNNQIAEYAVKVFAQAGLGKTVADCTPRAIAEAAQAGDPVAIQIWHDIAEWLGTALASVAWLLNPDAFVIGGGVAQAGALLFEPLQKKMQSMLSTVVWEGLKILPARFSNEAGIIGNAALAGDSVA
ncbi:ROK family protein [Verrucomicrobium sp. BvORR106]|uniref:ROK family protein n=1 Tax=Verrucomicrobium sp. BvORR106 TaxID=1403819 RepID=UPI00057028CE|nr:ROK family protein [Verrucomicrobium sp. BvORR106]